MIRRALLAAAFAISAAAITATPAQSIDLPPPGEESLHVINFYDSAQKTRVVGWRTFGCPGRPREEFGTVDTRWSTRHFAPC